MIPNAQAAAVVQRAHEFATAKGFRVLAQTVGNQLTFAKGSELWTGERRIIIAAWDVPGGANVTLEVWVETGWSDVSAKPGSLSGPRRKLWKTTAELCDYLGAPQAKGAFQH
jgi:hypothetical protein